MAAKRSARNRKKAAHHTDRGHQKRVRKYVQKELKRMQLHGTGFRVHPEFGWCHKELYRLGYEVDFESPTWWRKIRPLRRIATDNLPPPEWWYDRDRRCLVLQLDDTEMLISRQG